MELGYSLPAARGGRLDRTAAWRLAVGGLVAASLVARIWAAWLRATPNYFPDAYIYSSISRSLAAGHLPSIRGEVAHFPALLQPLVTAPAWWFGSVETGYRLTQAIDALAMSTVALAVWWTARRLGARRGHAFAAAAISLAVPDVGYSGWLLAEPFAYPLFVAAVGTGAVALARPTRRAQSTFVAFALLASFARVQLAVLFLAYVVAALALRRLRAQRVVLAGLGLVTVAGVIAVLGYYRGAPGGFHPGNLTSLGRNVFVLALASGWIIVPSGLLGLTAAWRRPRSEEERAFGALALAAGAGVVAEATLYGDGSLVHERYGCYVLPLLALGFALHAGRGWPWRRAHAALAGAMLVVSAAVPLSGWAAAGGNAHSFILTGLLEVESLAGSAGTGSLYVAATVGALSLAVVLCAWRRATAVAAVLAVFFCVAASAFATSFNVTNSRNVRAAFLPAGPSWAPAGATVVAGPVQRTSVLVQLFWNSDADRLALLPGATAPDAFAVQHTHIAADGSLVGISGPVVLAEDGTALIPLEPLRTNGPWLAARSPRLAAVLVGRYGDGWLAPSGRGHIFTPGRLSFTVTAPEDLTLTIGGRRLTMSTSTPTHVYVCVSGSFAYRFSKHGYSGPRQVSAKATFPRFTRDVGCSRGGGGRIRTSVG